MFFRQMANAIKALRKTMPITTILGPRQSGKTTLAQRLFANKPYVNSNGSIFGCRLWRIRMDF